MFGVLHEKCLNHLTFWFVSIRLTAFYIHKEKSMKKSFVAMLMLLSAIWIASAEITVPHFKPTVSEEEFDVLYYQFKPMTEYEVPNENQDEVSVTKAFKATFNGVEGEIRYSLFTETGTNTPDEIALWEKVIIMNIAGKGFVSKPAAFDSKAVLDEFNGNSGRSYLILAPRSKFGEGYSVIQLESFYKKGQGLCIRTFLCNDTEFIGIKDKKMNLDSDFVKYYHSFKFMDRNKKGEYKRPKK